MTINLRPKEDLKMMNTEEILYVVAKRGIYLIPRFTLISSKSMAELHLLVLIQVNCTQEEVEVDQEKQLCIII